MKKILLVEDDLSLSRGISFKLKRERYEVFTASTEKEALRTFQDNHIDLVISDIGLEEGDGFKLCEEIRKLSNVHIIFLTALDQEIDVVTGYDLGADDYITKPFSLIILISKVNALMKRIDDKVSQRDVLISGKIKLYVDEMKVTKNDSEVVLSKNELKLLKYLMINPLQIVTKDQLLEAIWDIDGQFVDENTIAVNIRRLRGKIEDDASNPNYIKNVRGIGYIWSMECIGK